MATYPLLHKPSFSYEDHLMYNQYAGDITNGFKRASTDIIKGQALSTKILNDTLNKNSEYLTKTIDSNFSNLASTLTDTNQTITRGFSQVGTAMQSVSKGVDNLSYGIDNINHNIGMGFNQLGSSLDGVSNQLSNIDSNILNVQRELIDLNIAMGGIDLQLQLQRKEMKKGFNSIINILENKRKTDAQEDFRDGIEYYKDGYKFPDKPIWFENAIKHLSASIQKYERNPLAHLHLAHIYHYQEKFRDFDKALHHYELCYTYGEADPKSSAITAQGYFYAGWLKAAVYNDIQSAIELTKKAVEFDSAFSEAHFYLARYYAITNNPQDAIKHLQLLIEKHNRNYAIKAKLEPDLEAISDDINTLLSNLKAKAKTKAYQELQTTIDKYSKYAIEPSDKEIVDKFYQKIDSLLKEDTYFSYLDTLPQIVKLDIAYQSLNLQQRDELKESIQNKIQYYKELFKEYEILKDNKVYKHLQDKVNSIEKNLNSLNPGKYKDTLRVNTQSTLYNIIQGISREIPDINQFSLSKKLTDHRIDVVSITFSPDGSLFAASSYREVYIYNTKDFSLSKKLTDHNGSLKSITFSPDGSLFASGSDDKTVCIYNTKNFSLSKKLTDHISWINSITFSPDGSLFASGSTDGTVCIYNIVAIAEKIEEYFKILKEDKERQIAYEKEQERLRLAKIKAEEEKKRLAKIEAEKARQKKLQQQKWRDEGRCEICGTKLGFFKKLSGATRCNNCL